MEEESNNNNKEDIEENKSNENKNNENNNQNNQTENNNNNKEDLEDNKSNENKNNENNNQNNQTENNNKKENNNNNETEEHNIQMIENEEEEEEEEDSEEFKDIVEENPTQLSGKNYKITKVDNDLPLLENIASTTEQKRLINKQIRKNSKAPKKLTKYFSLQEFPKSKYFTDDELKKIIKLVYKFHKNEEEQSEIHKFFLKTKINR